MISASQPVAKASASDALANNASASRSPVVRPGESGMTIVEMVMATALVFVIVIVTHSSIFTIHTVNEHGEATLEQQSTYRDVLSNIQEELALSTLEKDPVTNSSRYSITPDANGNQILRFQKLAGVEMVGDELQAVWSSDITISLDQQQRVIRTEQGQSRVLGSGIAKIQFATEGSGFSVQCVTPLRDPRTGDSVDITHKINVTPTN